nr:hypothetical protein [Pelagicoccus mobilis]
MVGGVGLDDGLDEVVLALEIVLEVARAHLRLFADGGHGRSVKPFLAKAEQGGFEDLPAAFAY